MNINEVYECTVLRVIDRKHFKDNSLHLEFVDAKKALVYKEKGDTFY